MAQLKSPYDQQEFPESVGAIAGSATSDKTIDELLTKIEQCPDEFAQRTALAYIAPHLSLRQVLRVLAMLGEPKKGAEALLALIPQLGKHGSVDKAFTWYRLLPDWAKGKTIEGLAPYLSAKQLEETIDDATHVDDAHQARARLLSSLSPHLSCKLTGRGLVAALAISNKFHRRVPLRTIMARLRQCPKMNQLQALSGALETASSRHRQDFLYDLGSLAPLAVSLGGTETVEASITAILDCMRWWK